MARFLIVAIGGAGGDLPPLIAATLALRDRGHETEFIGDESVGRVIAGLSIGMRVLSSRLDLGPRLVTAIRDSMAATGGDLEAAGPIVERRMAQWASEVATALDPAVAEIRPDAIVTSLFGVEVLDEARPPSPWAVVNSTFYVGPDPPRPLEQDVAPRAVPLIRRYAGLLGSADLVLHATDRVFDLSFDRLPPGHHYAGPLGIWEPPAEVPPYLDEPGAPWVLVSISSQLQDDLPLAEAALAALADRPVRVLLTVGPDHHPDEVSLRPRNAFVERTIPHSAVLRRSVLLVSHAGHGSVMKALWEGRPMVLVPWGRDQPGVAARAEALGVAEVVDRGKQAPVGLSDAIDRVLSAPRLRQTAAAHAERLHTTNPFAMAGSLLESLVE
jgi:UDP:flavonoid glycosyltransferase YjiC (YdhE family)